MSNSNLNSAKKAKNDEFYTQLSDVEKELKHYKDFFKEKKVLCNCNDDKWSAFFKYFSANFEYLGLKQLVCVSYNKNGHGMKYTYNDEGEFNVTDLNGNGSFSSDECVELLKECDVVVTNPPFSLFRDFVALLQEYGKKFLIIGNGNAVTYKEIFPLIKENKVWLGRTLFTGKMPFFRVPNDAVEKINNNRFEVREDGVYKQVNGVCWYTNIPNDTNREAVVSYKKYNPTEYPFYDNYNAIECGKMTDLPMDWNNIIGIPITGLKYLWSDGFIHADINGVSTQFEIVGILNPLLNGKRLYKRILIKRIV